MTGLIPTVKMESGHSVEGSFGREFSSIYIVRELQGLKSQVVEGCCAKFAFLKKTPYGKIFKNLFRKDSPSHRSTVGCKGGSWLT